MKKGWKLFLYFLGGVWTTFGFLIVMGAWNESERDYIAITGKLSKPVELIYEELDTHRTEKVVLSKIYLEQDHRAYSLAGRLYRWNEEGMKSIQVGDEVRLMVKKTSFLGGFEIDRNTKSVSVSGVYNQSGQTIIPLEKGIAQSKNRLWLGIGLMSLGLFVGFWTSSKN